MRYEQAHSCTKDHLCHYTELLYPKCKLDSATIQVLTFLIIYFIVYLEQKHKKTP